MHPGRTLLLRHIVLGLLLLFFLSGCAAVQTKGTPGGLVHEEEVRKIFETDTVLPDHVYYYSGAEDEPEAIIGIRTGITLQARYWRRIDLTPEKLQAWNQRIDNAHRVRFGYRGAWIMTPDGQRAGVWYSKYEQTEIYFPKTDTIILYTPDPPPVRGCVRRGFPFLEF